MAHPYHHSRSSARKFGGVPEDYIHIHNWFDQTKQMVADFRHRLLLHNSFGIFICEQVFGETFVRESDGKRVPTRLIGEQHVQEDFGFIPDIGDILKLMPIENWMGKGARKLSQELGEDDNG